MTREPTATDAFKPLTTQATCPECGTVREIVSLTGVTSKTCDQCIDAEEAKAKARSTYQPTVRGTARPVEQDVDLTPPPRTAQGEWWHD